MIFVYGKQTCSGFVVLGRLFQAVFGSNSAFPNRPSASRLHSFRILNAVAAGFVAGLPSGEESS